MASPKKFSEETKKKAVKLFKEGARAEDLAKQFNTTKFSIYNWTKDKANDNWTKDKVEIKESTPQNFYRERCAILEKENEDLRDERRMILKILKG